ncbi:MAG TPA: sugar phosphate nucleotidyltransferase [Polyangiaceae bacterium]|nr:sugar phosphate nucleotidyltransferase [Polyangiaceae bacterium]
MNQSGNSASAEQKRLWTIVLAAGEGTRLQALTHALHGEALPKQFARIQGGRSLLQATLERTSHWSPPERTVIVVSAEREALARRQVRAVEGVEVVAQPRNVGTGPGLMLPLCHVLARDPDAVVAVVPSDHYVKDTAPFVESVRRAEAMARARDTVVLVAAVPNRPETQYGWILTEGTNGNRSVASFHEKPESAVAERLFASGGLWNTFMMVGSARAFWRIASAHLPVQAMLFGPYRAAIGSVAAGPTLSRIYRAMPQADFSRDVLERAPDLGVVPLSSCGWSDWGTPERILDSLRGSADYDALLGRMEERRESGVFSKREATTKGSEAA